MNYRIILCGLSAALALAACSREGTDPDVVTDGDEGAHYMTVNIATTKTAGTRASGDQTTGDPNDSATYEEGDENTVNSVRFYFFDKDGNAAAVKKGDDGKYHNYVDATPSAAGTEMPNIEKKLEVVIILNYANGDDRPASMAAVVNPAKATYGTTTLAACTDDLSLDALTAICADYSEAGTSTGTAFLMTSSVYADNGEKVLAVELTDANLQQTEELAEANPVDVYVERVLAKVRFNQTTSLSDGEYINATTKTGAAITTSDGKELYIKLIGWDVTATTDKSYLFKSIDASWDTNKNWGSTNPWTYPDYHRSYWAINPKEATVSYGTYAAATAVTNFKGGYTYVQENAADNDADGGVPTKVIIAAQLYVKDGDSYAEATIYEYAGVRYASEEDCKNAMLKALAPNAYTIKDGSATYEPIDADDVKIVSAATAGKVAKDGTGAYKAYLALTEDAKAETWYSVTDGTATGLDADGLTTTLQEIYASVYTEGASYFYFPIQHLGYGVDGAEFGEYGVIRNHIYDIDITGISGLGTAVYDPDSNIIPEKPDDDWFVAAKINVLSWRVVSNNVELDW